MDAALNSHFDLDSMYTYSRRRNPSPSLTRSLLLVLPFQGCPLKPVQSPPRSSDRRWFLHQDSRRLATNQYEICGLDYAKKGFFMRSSSTVVRGPWPGARRVAGESMRMLL
ncbi:MAG: hypothetical protein K9M81_04340 [Chthoniobacterales bacterium]|nr:hypothetical protein [Chthoniobacterales bacterium]